MKRISCLLGVFLCIFGALSAVFAPVEAHAAAAVINTSTSNDGYFTVSHNADLGCKMKVGVTHQSSTEYFSYEPGTEGSFTFDSGNGTYTITLYRRVYGNAYSTVTSKQVVVNMESDLAPYLASTELIKFSETDSVGMMAAELCEEKETDGEKLVAIYNYIARNFEYDDEFAAKVTKGLITSYDPHTADILKANKGVCYDFSVLFAAMCRSQGIPCSVVKGNRFGGYHAWNRVYINEEWVEVDMTMAVANGRAAKKLSDCIYKAEKTAVKSKANLASAA